MNIETVDEIKKEGNEEKVELEANLQENKDVQENTSKNLKTKRNPFEKILDDSILICEESAENFKQSEAGDQDTRNKEFFEIMKSDLLNIKSCYENKKKTLLKKSTIDVKTEDKAPEYSKKKKVSNVKEKKELIDTSEIAKKIEENERSMNLEKEKDPCITPVKAKSDSIGDDNISPQGVLTKEKIVKSEGAQSKNHNSLNSEKKLKNEKNNMKIMQFFNKGGMITPNSLTTNKNSGHKILDESKSDSKNIHSPKQTIRTDNLLKITPFNKNYDSHMECDDLFNNKNNHEVLKGELVGNNINLTSQETDEPKFFYIKNGPHSNIIDFNAKYVIPNLPKPIADFYKLKGDEICDTGKYKKVYESYIKKLLKSVPETQNKHKMRRRRIIYIHDSFMSHIKFPEKSSSIINPRNPFKKDDYIIDYDKDSEEEYMEENAEDIKSSDNSADEEEMNEEEEEEGRWIVPDGHLSEDEVSEREDLMAVDIAKGDQKSKSIMDILEIRKNYSKPVFISFNNLNMTSDNRIKTVQNLLTAKIYNPKSQNSTVPNSEPSNSDFPISITSRQTEETLKKGGFHSNIKDRLDEVVRNIHYSYMTKDFIIKEINDKYPTISKASLQSFFKNNVLRNKCEKTGRVNLS